MDKRGYMKEITRLRKKLELIEKALDIVCRVVTSDYLELWGKCDRCKDDTLCDKCKYFKRELKMKKEYYIDKARQKWNF